MSSDAAASENGFFLFVMAGLDPATHVSDTVPDGSMDPRIKSGGDEIWWGAQRPRPAIEGHQAMERSD